VALRSSPCLEDLGRHPGIRHALKYETWETSDFRAGNSSHFSQSHNPLLKSQPARVDQYTVLRSHGRGDHWLRTLTNEPCTSRELMSDCFFGGIADKRKLLKDEADEPFSEIFERKA
jgi:hypothetical protein